MDADKELSGSGGGIGKVGYLKGFLRLIQDHCTHNFYPIALMK
jgi:hypothetical protein